MGGLGHDFKVGVNLINEPHLFATFNGGVDDYFYTHLTDERAGAIQTVTRNGGVGDVNIPFKQYSTYVQDDWRVSDRLTFNLGLRYDLVKGVQIDQIAEPELPGVAGCRPRAARFQAVPGMDSFGKDPQDDLDNFQPRVGFAYDVHGNGRDVVRGGWGVYQDFGYTNSNVLFAAIDSSGLGHGPIFSVNNTAGIRKADGTLFRVGDPIASIISQNEADPTRIPLFGQVASPTLQQPFTRQANIGWAHQLSASTALTADYVHIDGRDLNMRFRYNYRDPATGLRRLSGLDIRPNTLAFRAAINDGESRYDGLILGVRRRMSKGLDFSASYTLAKATSNIGAAIRRAGCELHPGRDQPVRRRAAGALGTIGCASPRVGERSHPRPVGHPGGALLPVPLRPSHLHLRRSGPERRQQQQRHHGQGVSVPTAKAWRQGRLAIARK